MTRVYLALGDSMSIDLHTGVIGGGAVSQFHRWLGADWQRADHCRDGCGIDSVPRTGKGDLVTLTIGGNDLFLMQGYYVRVGLAEFVEAHRNLLLDLREANPRSPILVGNVYEPQFKLDARRLALLEEANEAIRTNVESIGAHLIDIHAAFRGREDRFLCKLIEPTLEGATSIAQLFQRAFEAHGSHG
jgi:lysophospholipase L1-like esterase